MPDEKSMFERQAAWQRSRAKLPWGEKIRMAVVMRDAQRALRKKTSGPSGARQKDAGA
ncbi:MAG: hypothetical protein JXB04_02460 [Kiritimatiellae bacterium]|nr:hypothetical protein [Kiritimatiellia bacterium]